MPVSTRWQYSTPAVSWSSSDALPGVILASHLYKEEALAEDTSDQLGLWLGGNLRLPGGSVWTQDADVARATSQLLRLLLRETSEVAAPTASAFVLKIHIPPNLPSSPLPDRQDVSDSLEVETVLPFLQHCHMAPSLSATQSHPTNIQPPLSAGAGEGEKVKRGRQWGAVGLPGQQQDSNSEEVGPSLSRKT